MITEITASMIASFKRCPKRYEFEYIHDLRPVSSSDALMIGIDYHTNVEKILNHEEYDHNGLSGKMAEAFEKYIDWQEWNAKSEQEFKIRLARGIYLKGRLDGITDNGVPIEHKTTGQADLLRYIDHLAYDDQIAIYMLATCSTHAIYTIIQKPSIKLRQNETEEEYLARVAEWYTPEHITCVNVVRTLKELEEKRQEIIHIAKQIQKTKFFWRNPCDCALTSCAYSSICLNYEPQMQLVGFERREK